MRYKQREVIGRYSKSWCTIVPRYFNAASDLCLADYIVANACKDRSCFNHQEA